MSKKKTAAKPSKAPRGPKHIQARLSYLHQAAQYLAKQQGRPREPATPRASTSSTSDAVRKQDRGQPSPCLGNPHRLISDLRSISRKTMVRLAPEVKHSFCKVCDAPLIDGQTSMKHIENASRGQQKPWADVLVVQCQTCGTSKRFPIGAKRPPKKADREHLVLDESQKATSPAGHQSGGVEKGGVHQHRSQIESPESTRNGIPEG